MTVDSPGFSQVAQTIDLEVGQQATIDMQLNVGAELQTVTVQATGELLKTQDASVGEVVEKRSVEGLPLNGRMLIDLVLTVPGAHVSHGAATGDMSTVLEARPAVGGQHRWKPFQRQLFLSRWRHQHRSDFQRAEPERLARRGAGVPGSDRKLFG